MSTLGSTLPSHPNIIVLITLTFSIIFAHPYPKSQSVTLYRMKPVVDSETTLSDHVYSFIHHDSPTLHPKLVINLPLRPCRRRYPAPLIQPKV